MAGRFALAERLGMTVAELNRRVTPAELTLWGAYSSWQRMEQELEQARQEAAQREVKTFG